MLGRKVVITNISSLYNTRKPFT